MRQHPTAERKGPGDRSWWKQLAGEVECFRAGRPESRLELRGGSETARPVVNVRTVGYAHLQEAHPVPVALDAEKTGVGGRSLRDRGLDPADP